MTQGKKQEWLLPKRRLVEGGIMGVVVDKTCFASISSLSQLLHLTSVRSSPQTNFGEYKKIPSVVKYLVSDNSMSFNRFLLVYNTSAVLLQFTNFFFESINYFLRNLPFQQTVLILLRCHLFGKPQPKCPLNGAL